MDSSLWWDYPPGTRVMTREGFPGVVASVEDGPVAGAEEYLVTLDNGMGGGRYASSELRPLTQAQGQQAAVVHTADTDYPELGDILVRRPDHQTVIRTGSLQASAATYYLPTAESLAYEEQASALLRQANDTMQPVEVPDEWIETGQAHDLLTAAWGGQVRDCNWARAEDIRVVAADDGKTYLMPPDFETEVTVDEDGKRHIVHEGGIIDFLRGSPNPSKNYQGLGHEWSYDWCRYRRNSRCFYPKTLNAAASKTAGYAVWVPEDRGYCPRIKWDDQEHCPVGEPGPHVPGGFTDATVSWEAGGQRGGHPAPGYQPPAGMQPTFTSALTTLATWPADLGFHMTATWAEVRQKGKEIAKDGGVRILSAHNGIVSGEVRGDTNIYMTAITRVPGKYAVAYWECGCAWAAYSWGRTGKWKKFEGRMCSHALALNYEAQRREMFGKTIQEDRQPANWKDPTIPVKWPGQWDRSKGRFAALEVGDRDEPPAVEFARSAMAEGVSPNDALRLLVVMGAKHPAALLALAFGGSFMAKVRGLVQRVMIDVQGIVRTSDGQPIAANEVLYPTYDPHLGLSLSDRRASKTAAGSDPGAAARALIQLARRHEPETTSLLKTLVNRAHGHMSGLEYRLKDEDSLTRKIKTEMPEHNGDAGKTAANISDSLRYTMLFRPEEYVDGARDTLAELQSKGYRARVKNYWERGDNYNGINAAMTTPDGHPFELQFHTPETHDIKERQAHPLYKRFRTATDHRERYILDRKMREMFDKAEIPGGALGIPTLKRVTPVAPPEQKAAFAQGNVEHHYRLLHNFEGNPVTLLRHVVDHDKPDARTEVWRNNKWETENHYAAHFFMGDPRSEEVSEDKAHEMTNGHAKDAVKRSVPMEDHYVGLTNRVGGIHAVHPDDYTDDNGGFAAARCGAWVSVDHKGDSPMTFADNYGDPPSCKKCQRATKTAGRNADPCTACGGTGEQGTGHECYLCDGSGLGDEERSSRALGMDNANPENELLVGRDDSIGQEPVLAALQSEAGGPPIHPDHHMDVIESDGKFIPHCSCDWTDPETPVTDDQTLAHLLTVIHVQEKAHEAGYPLLTGSGYGHPDQHATNGPAPFCQGCGFYHHPGDKHYRLQPTAEVAHRIDPQQEFEHDPGDDSITEDYAHHIHHETEPGTHHRYPYDKPQYDRSLWGRGGFVGAKKDEGDDPPTVSGVVLKAADTGRVLMLQRALEDPNDKAAGTWEFPGGHHEDGDKHSLDAAIREFEEEVGQRFPEGGHLTHVWRNGPYCGHVVVIPEEKAIKFDHGRIVPNPDDPDGDNSEQVAWWDPEHARKNPALREECKSNPWNEIKKAASRSAVLADAGRDADVDAVPDRPGAAVGDNGAVGRFLTLDDLAPFMPADGRKALNQTYRDQGDEWLFVDDGVSPTLAHTEASVDAAWLNEKADLIAKSLGLPRERLQSVVDDIVLRHGLSSVVAMTQQEFAERVMADLHDEPEPALPSTDGDVEGPTTDAEAMAMGGRDDVTETREDMSLPPLSGGADLLRRHEAAMAAGTPEASPLSHLLAGTQRSDDVAAQAQEFLQKSALKPFTPAERKALIDEGMDVEASNLDRLDIAGTHYEALERATASMEENDDIANFMMWG